MSAATAGATGTVVDQYFTVQVQSDGDTDWYNTTDDKYDSREQAQSYIDEQGGQNVVDGLDLGELFTYRILRYEIHEFAVE